MCLDYASEVKGGGNTSVNALQYWVPKLYKSFFLKFKLGKFQADAFNEACVTASRHWALTWMSITAVCNADKYVNFSNKIYFVFR